jgi:UDP-glucose 4-epimerase
MNILLTGGSGVIGIRFIQKMIDSVKIISLGREFINFPEQFRHHKNFKFYEFDLNSENEILVPDKVDVILHLAANVTNPKLVSKDYELNLKSTKKLIEFAKKNNVEQFLFASSISVYGLHENFALEDSILKADSDYAKSKIESENLLLNSGIKYYSIFRIASVFGKETKGFIYKLEKLFQKKIIPVPIDFFQKKSFIHLEDLVSFFEKALKHKKQGIYNLAYPVGFNFFDILESITEDKNSDFYFKIKLSPFVLKLVSILNGILYKTKLVKTNKRIDLKPIQEFIWVNSDKAIKEFSYSPKISLLSKWRDI